MAWAIFLAAAVLVSVPVFVQAPMVRYFPWLSLGLTAGWWQLSRWLKARAPWAVWGDLMSGFTWSWLAGSLYWGWLRWEPLVHLPVEAIGLPFALWAWRRHRDLVGNLFYLGSLVGTAMTDLYFYLTGLIPAWRQVMTVEPEAAAPILHAALDQVQTEWGIAWAIAIVMLLLGMGCWALALRRFHWQAFSGAILSTILVDGLFWIAASLA